MLHSEWKPEAIEQIIRTLVSQELKLPPGAITHATNLRELPGIESIKVLRIIAKLENHYDIELADDVVFRISTVGELVRSIRDLAPAAAAAAAGEERQ